MSEGQTSRTRAPFCWGALCCFEDLHLLLANPGWISAAYRCPRKVTPGRTEGNDVNAPTYQRGLRNHVHCYRQDPRNEELQARFETVIREKLEFLVTPRFLPFSLFSKKPHLWCPVGLRIPFLL